MDRFLNTVKAHASAMDQAQAQPRFAIVTSVDPAAHAARVTLQPEGVLTGWLPVLAPWIGPGWGMVCLPSPGDQVLVLPQEGDAEHGIVAGRVYSNTQRPPAAPVGELWLVHQSGTFLKLHNDGSIEGQAAAWNLTGPVNITGDTRITGNLSISGDLHVGGDVYDRLGSLDGFRQVYDQHTHLDSLHGITTVPTPQIQD